MAEENGCGARDNGPVKGSIRVVGIGPGALNQLSGRAIEALTSSDAVVGYTRYVELIAPLIRDKEVYSTGMTFEVERCRRAIGLAREGKRVAVVSSGDAGIYGMAGLIMELEAATSDASGRLDIEVIPGIPAFVAAAALAGAPIMHDFASISLSDLLTESVKIEERINAAAKADFVTVFYNPKSSKRTEGLKKAVEIMLRHRRPSTPAAIVRNAARPEERCVVTTLGGVPEHYGSIDMLTIIIIGNSETFIEHGRMITPRGYGVK